MPLDKIPTPVQPHQQGQTHLPEEDPPPPYHPPPAGAAPAARAAPSPDVQKAEAPLKIEQAHRAITGEYLVFDGGSSVRPDAYLRTTHSKINTALWIEGSWDRPFVIDAGTTHSFIDLAIHTLDASQPIDVTAQSSHACVQLALPPSFHGIITIYTTHAIHKLSPELQANSVRVSAPDSADPKTVAYRVGGPDGKSRVELKSSHANVTAGYTTDAKPVGKGSSCQLM